MQCGYRNLDRNLCRVQASNHLTPCGPNSYADLIEATFPQLYMVRWGDLAGPSSWLFCDNFWTMISCCAAVKNSEFKIALETRVRSGSCWCVHLQIILYMESFVQIFWSLQSNIKHKLNANVTNILQLLKPLRILYNNHSCSNPCSSKKSW